MIDLYTPDGWINVPAIAERPTWLKVLIGARQVGKTYGVLKWHLERPENKFILMRRTTDELKMIAKNAMLDPFGAFVPEYNVRIFAAGMSYIIADHDEEGKQLAGTERGAALSLPMIGNVRGFDGSIFSSVILDEAVPEKGTRVLKTEGESLLNAYTTISGNRELRGEPPLVLWLLANTNNINSPILSALDLTDEILRMRRRGFEYTELDGVSIFQGSSEAVTSRRRETVLARRVPPESNFARMAYGNEWAYDDSPLIKSRSIKGLTPLCSFGGLYIWEGLSGYYVCSARHKAAAYPDNDFNRGQFTADYRWLVRWYAAGLVTFADLKLLAQFKQLFDVDF